MVAENDKTPISWTHAKAGDEFVELEDGRMVRRVDLKRYHKWRTRHDRKPIYTVPGQPATKYYVMRGKKPYGEE